MPSFFLLQLTLRVCFVAFSKRLNLTILIILSTFFKYLHMLHPSWPIYSLILFELLLEILLSIDASISRFKCFPGVCGYWHVSIKLLCTGYVFTLS